MQIIDGVIFIVGIGFNSNIYLVGKEEIGIIDAGASPNYVSHILEKLHEHNLKKENVKKVILTHRHPDHIQGLSGLIEAFDPQVYIHKEDARALTRKVAEKAHLLEGGETLEIDTFLFQVIHTPGHSPGGICLYEPNHKVLFSGDTIFSQGAVGRVDLMGGNGRLLIESIEKLLKLDVEFLCPGHMSCVKNGNDHVESSYQFAKMFL